jgi:hypothetical protein
VPGNAIPQFTDTGVMGTVRITAANTSSEGGGTIGTDIFLVFTADATDGTFLEFVRFIPRATAPTNTNATVARVFVSTQSVGATTSANTNLIAEVTLPQVSADNAAGAVQWFDVPVNQRIPAGQSILATTHGAPAAATSWGAMAFGGDY